ncbi:MAG: AlpA family phage regulatory protein [Acidobacteria bacterium]|nr:AlpA family phage regulatory protein [Acidobacteriota bacterium]
MEKRLLRRDEVMDLLQISEATLYRWQREGLIPQPVALGPRSKRWPVDEIEAFIAGKRSKKDGPRAK